MSAPIMLQRWIEMARRHWREHLPKLYARLKANGTLDRELMAAAQLTFDAMKEWEAQGASHEEAWQATRELWLLPREEPELKAERSPMSPAHEAIRGLNKMMQRD